MTSQRTKSRVRSYVRIIRLYYHNTVSFLNEVLSEDILSIIEANNLWWPMTYDFFTNDCIMSIGIGNTMVLFLSAAIELSVWR